MWSHIKFIHVETSSYLIEESTIISFEQILFSFPNSSQKKSIVGVEKESTVT